MPSQILWGIWRFSFAVALLSLILKTLQPWGPLDSDVERTDLIQIIQHECFDTLLNYSLNPHAEGCESLTEELRLPSPEESSRFLTRLSVSGVRDVIIQMRFPRNLGMCISQYITCPYHDVWMIGSGVGVYNMSLDKTDLPLRIETPRLRTASVLSYTPVFNSRQHQFTGTPCGWLHLRLKPRIHGYDQGIAHCHLEPIMEHFGFRMVDPDTMSALGVHHLLPPHS